MPTGRWKKLAIAAAILIVGIGMALTFRREQSAEAPTSADNLVTPDVVRQPAADRIAERKAQPEPALAGRIEPYSPDEARASSGDTSVSFASATLAPAPQTDASLKWQTVRRPDSAAAAVPETDGTIFDRPNVGRPATFGESAREKRHKIADGDTLAALARRYLGAEQRSLDLFEYNRDVLTTPDLLPIGKELRIPPRDFVPAEPPPLESQSRNLTAVSDPVASREIDTATARQAPSPIATAPSLEQTYVVQPHDTLALIARKLYGDISRQGDLMAANRKQLRSAKDLRPGMTLVVPAAPGNRR